MEDNTEFKLMPTTKFDLNYRDGNRDVSEAHFIKIAEKIDSLYLTDLFPILIDQNKFIDDGQHRYAASKLLGTPYYYITTDMTVADVTRANENTYRYTLDDILGSCAKMGLEPYEYALNHRNEFKAFRLTDVIRLNKSNPGDFSDFKFKAESPNFTKRVSLLSNDFDGIFDSISHVFHHLAGKKASYSGYRGAIEFLAKCSGYDHARMRSKIAKSPTRLLPAKTRYDAMRVLTSIYNGNASSADVVDLARLRADVDFDESPILASAPISPTRGISNPYKAVVNVRSSTAYDDFSLSPYIRSTSDRKIEVLEQEIRRHDWLKYYPIVVGKGNVILDGQRRFLAAKKLKKPFWYVNSDNITFPMLMSAGVLTLSWGLKDYLKHHVDQGNENYKGISLFVVENRLSLSEVLASMIPAGMLTRVFYGDFKRGELRFDRAVADRWIFGCYEVVPKGIYFEEREILKKAIFRIASTTRECDWTKIKDTLDNVMFWSDGRFLVDEFVSSSISRFCVQS